jgi:hypothetical protein
MKHLMTAAKAAISHDGTPIGIMIGWLLWGLAWVLNSRSIEMLLYGGMFVAVLWYSLMTFALYVGQGIGVSQAELMKSVGMFIASLPHREHLLLVAMAVLLGIALFNWSLFTVALALGAAVGMAYRLNYYAQQPVD